MFSKSRIFLSHKKGLLGLRGVRHRLLRRQPGHHHRQRRARPLERPRHGQWKKTLLGNRGLCRANLNFEKSAINGKKGLVSQFQVKSNNLKNKKTVYSFLKIANQFFFKVNLICTGSHFCRALFYGVATRAWLVVKKNATFFLLRGVKWGRKWCWCQRGWGNWGCSLGFVGGRGGYFLLFCVSCCWGARMDLTFSWFFLIFRKLSTPWGRSTLMHGSIHDGGQTLGI